MKQHIQRVKIFIVAKYEMHNKKITKIKIWW